MREKIFTKVVLITMALLLVLSMGCSKSSKNTSNKTKASVNGNQQIQSTVKAKATINKNLDQLDKDLNQLDKSESGADSLNVNDFN